MQDRVAIFFDLLRRFQISLVSPIVPVFTILCRILAANIRPALVNATAIVRLKMLARGVDQEIPVFVFRKHSGTVVQQVPANEFEIVPRGRGIDGQREVPAALGRAVFAEYLPCGNKFPRDFPGKG